jgi:NitT/TauT family transport system ATP-binding protein
VTAVMVTHDLEEAVFVADRVLVMSPRPGRICAAVVVDLPRPRTLEVTYTEFFGALSRRVREALERPTGGR